MGRGAHLALGDVVHVDRERPQGVLGVRPLRRIVPVIQDIAQLLQLRKGLHRELLACSPLTLLPRQILWMRCPLVVARVPSLVSTPNDR